MDTAGGVIMNLAELRGKIPRNQLAAELHISISSLEKYERGDRTPSDKVKRRYAEYFGKTVQEIFFDD